MRIFSIGILAVAAALTGATAFAAEKPSAAAPINPGFEKMKTLVGDWESKSPEGKTFSGSIRLVSAGSALMITSNSEDDMVTMIHPDGATLMATHYCAAHNQPRFVASSSSNPNVITFKFKDVTNLASPDEGYMSGVVYTFVDHDHYTESWTWHEGGKDQVVSFNLTRKK